MKNSFKRCLAALSASAMMATAMPFAANADETAAVVNSDRITIGSASVNIADQGIKYGDANLDGYVTVSDAVAILQYIANSSKDSLNAQAKINADVDGEAGVTGKDAAKIQSLDAGIITEL